MKDQSTKIKRLAERFSQAGRDAILKKLVNHSGRDVLGATASTSTFSLGAEPILVYTGNAIVYIEQEDVPDSCSYFVRAVDSDGNKSDAKIFMPIITEFIPFE